MNYFNAKPKAYVNTKTNALEQLQKMLELQPGLYDKCVSTLGFAYGFNQLANRAVHFDYLLSKGIIPKDYLESYEAVE